MRLAPLVAALGVAQIASWGSLFYAIGVLGAPMRSELGVSELFLFGAFTAGLLVSGTLAPWVGRSIDRLGGRIVLSLGSIASALAFAVLALASHWSVMVLGWLLAGASMAAALYDPAFATLSQHAGVHYRKAVTALTLLGGLASTVYWPLSHLLLEACGWRATWWIYAAIQAGVCLPIHFFCIPRREAPEGAHEALPAEARPAAATGTSLRWLTAAFAIASFVAGIVAVHLIALLTAAGLDAGEAVTISMLMGPMQVTARLGEMATSRRVRAVSVGASAFVLLFAAVAALMGTRGFGAAAILFVACFGAGNGLLTIARGTAPAEIYGREGLGALLGHIGRSAFYARALAPAAFPALLALGLSQRASLAALAAAALAGLAAYAIAARAALSPNRHTPSL